MAGARTQPEQAFLDVVLSVTICGRAGLVSQSASSLYHLWEEEGRKPNPIGLSCWSSPAAPSTLEWARAVSAKDVHYARLDVIVPVYKGYADTLAAIYAVLTNAQNTPFNLIVINDSSPDKELTKELRQLHGRGLFSYHENSENLGFVGTSTGASTFIQRTMSFFSIRMQSCMETGSTAF